MAIKKSFSIAEGKRQYLRFVENAAKQALEKARLDKDELQRLIENGDEFQRRIMTAVKKLSIINRFAKEEFSSGYMYPKDYKVKGIAEQIATLKLLFPELKNATYSKNIASRPLPPDAEGWFAIPRWEKIGLTYGKAVGKVFTAFKLLKREFHSYRREEEIECPGYLRQHVKTEKAFQKLGNKQKGHDILIVPCQFGFRHRGRSVRRARELMNAGEFGLGVFAAGCMILTHPEREVQNEQLHIDCAGDEYSHDADNTFSYAPTFFCDDDGKVKSIVRLCAQADKTRGSASGFLF